MPKITRETTIQFVRKHVDLLDSRDEQKLSEEDSAVYNMLKELVSRNSTQSNLDAMIRKTGFDQENSNLNSIIQKCIEDLFKTALKSELSPPSLSFSIFSGACAWAGKYMGGAGWAGILCAIAGLIGGAVLGTVFLTKPEPTFILATLQLAHRVCQRFPERKDRIIEAFGENLFNKLGTWANKQDGWAKGIHRAAWLHLMPKELPEQDADASSQLRRI